MLVSEFDFDLPEALVAQTAAPRGESRLLVVSRGDAPSQHTHISELPRFLQSGDVVRCEIEGLGVIEHAVA